MAGAILLNNTANSCGKLNLNQILGKEGDRRYGVETVEKELDLLSGETLA